MGRTLTPVDAHTIINLVNKEANGANATVTAVDSSSFISAGEEIQQTGNENTLGALSLVMGRTFAAARPYQAKFGLINPIDTGLYSHRLRKISFYSREAQSSGSFNTNINDKNFKKGYTNNSASGATASMWEQNPPVPLEINFAGSSVWQDSTTIHKQQIQQAFRSEDDFNTFVEGCMIEKGNDLEMEKEAWNKLVFLNYVAGVYDLKDKMPGSVINLTAGFNKKFGTTYTSEELRTTHLRDFLGYFVSEFKNVSDLLTHRTTKYHWTPTKEDYLLLRHTPYNKQRVFLYQPMFRDAESQVLPEIFRPEYLDIKTQYEGVMYWQNINEPSKINITPAIPDTSGKKAGQVKGAAAQIPYLVGCIFDVDAVMTDYQLDDASATPIEARKKFYNMWWDYARNGINDFTENAVIFIMDDAPAA